MIARKIDLKYLIDILISPTYLALCIFLCLCLTLMCIPLFFVFLHTRANIDVILAKCMHKFMPSMFKGDIIARIRNGSKVLDVGAGSGVLAHAISMKKMAQVVCLDIRKRHTIHLSYVIYDGSRMPFKDKTFDYVLLHYVLHHIRKPETTLRECRRVCRNKILIAEDEAPISPDYFMNIQHTFFIPFVKPKDKFTYCSPGKWKEMFKKCGLGVECMESKWWLGPLKRVIFTLTPTK